MMSLHNTAGSHVEHFKSLFLVAYCGSLDLPFMGYLNQTDMLALAVGRTE
jgi:hypothetical protein